jgi:hypothetical protein
MCSKVTQTSVSGQNFSTLDDTYLQFERAHKAAGGDQQQGVSGAGGLDHEIHQESSGFCKIETNQNERQVMRAVQASVAQSQHGPTRKGAGSNQACNADSQWAGGQDSKQVATSRPKEEDIGSLIFAAPATQSNLLEYFGVSAGFIHATQSVSQQNNAGKDTEPNSCSGHVCGALITCSEGFCSSSQNPNPCGPFEFPNPVTGKCESID